MAHPDRNGGGGLSLRTLLIASAASLTAAMLTSRLFPPGTVYTAALTPIIVAAVSEVLNRPADRVSELRRQRRTMVLEAQELETARVLGEDPSPLAGAPDFAQGAAAEELHGNGSGAHAPMRIHRRRSRALHPKVWIATGLAGFAIAVAVLTLPELIFGGSVSTSHRTTFFGGGSSSTKTNTSTTPTQTETTQTQTTVTETVPATTPTDTTPTQTETTTTDTGTSTTPSGGTAPPSDTGTSTAPSGVVPPTP